MFNAIKVGRLSIENRVGVSPMCMYSSTDGHLNDWHIAHLGSFAIHGARLIFVEATAVLPNGRISPFDSGLWKDEQIESHKRVVDFLHSQGSSVCLQIAHAGRKASTFAPYEQKGMSVYCTPDQGGWDDVWSPLNLPFRPEKGIAPHAMTNKEIELLIESFGKSAERAHKAGYDLLEIHGAHGYLLNEFLSPITNQRSDEWGGKEFENRIGILLKVIQRVRQSWPIEKPLGIRLSCDDGLSGAGWTIHDTVKLVKIICKEPFSLDFVDCSSGGISMDSSVFQSHEGFNISHSRAVKEALNELKSDAKVMVVGGFHDPLSVDSAIANGDADIVLMARQFLREPTWMKRAAETVGKEPFYARQYLRSKK